MSVRVFTGSGLITGSDRIGPDRARNLSFSYFLKLLFIISMFVKYVYNHNNDVWIIGWAFQVAATIDARSDHLVSRLVELKLTESGPNLIKYLIFFLYDYVC